MEDFSDENLNDPIRLELADRIHVETDGSQDWAAFAPATGIAELNDGRELREEVAKQFGAPEWPLTREQHLEKATQCMTFGGQADRAEALARLMTNFDKLDDVHEALAGALD